MGLIRSALGDIASARDDYDARKGSHAWSLEVRGRDNRSFDDISGTYPVIGPLGETGFILEGPEGPRSICHAGSCDWYAEHAALIKGQSQNTTTTTFLADRITSDSLTETLAPLESTGRVYIVGQLECYTYFTHAANRRSHRRESHRPLCRCRGTCSLEKVNA